MSTRPEAAVDSRGRRRARDTRAALLEHAVALTRECGPDALSLREVQRRAGVSPAAAYRHYRDREALVFAVGQRASAMLGTHLRAAMSSAEAADAKNATAAEQAIARFRAGTKGYVDFARNEAGLFRAILLTGETTEQIQHPAPESLDATGVGPFQLLQESLRDLATQQVLPPARSEWDDLAVWAASHGFAVLTLDGPLRFLSEELQDAALERLLDIFLAGLSKATSTAVGATGEQFSTSPSGAGS